jgi:elongation factor Ts
MQIAASAPQFISSADIPAATIARQTAIFQEQLKIANKPVAAWPKIIEGKLNKFYNEICLLNQESIKDNKKTVQQTIQDVEKIVDGKINVVRFERYALGE